MPLLPKVQQRRLFPTRIIQSGQKTAQDGIATEARPGYAAALPDSQVCMLPASAA